MIKKFKILYGGAGLMEALLAIGLLSSLTPFIFKSINKQTATTRNIALAKEIENVVYAVSNYMDAHMPVHSEQTSSTSTPVENVPHSVSGATQISSLLSDFGLNSNLVAIYNLFTEVHLIMNKKTDSIDGYFILSGGNMEPLHLQEVAAMIGPNAGVVDEGSVYGMAHNWDLNTDNILPSSNKVSSGLIIQISRGAGRGDIYLNRVIPEKAIMYTDIFMGETNNNRKCKTDKKISITDNKGKPIDFKIVNTGVIDLKRISQSFDYKGSYQKLEGQIDGKEIPQFKVSDLTSVGDLKISNFIIPNPSQFVEPDDGQILTIKANKQMTSLVDTTTKLNDPSKDSYIGLTLNSIDASSSNLKPYTDKSPIRNINIVNLYTQKAQSNIFLSKSSIFNSNSIIRAKEIRTPDVIWGATVNAGTIVTGKITYGTTIDQDNKKLIDENGIMYVPNFQISSYSFDVSVNESEDGKYNSKNIKDVIEAIEKNVRNTCVNWNTKYNAITGKKSECMSILNISS